MRTLVSIFLGLMAVNENTLIQAQEATGANEEHLQAQVEELRQKEANLESELRGIREQIASLLKEIDRTKLDELIGSGSALKVMTNIATVLYERPSFGSKSQARVPYQAEIVVFRFGGSDQRSLKQVRFWEVQYGDARGFL